MKCEKCNTEMVFVAEVDYGDGDIRTIYVCPKCREKITIYK